jgi:hypothetical protein
METDHAHTHTHTRGEGGGQEEGWRPALLPPSPLALSKHTSIDVYTHTHTHTQSFNILIHFHKDIIGPLTSPYTTHTHAHTQAQKGPKALRSAHLYKNLTHTHTHTQLLVGFDPIREYVEKLKKRYGHVCVFFISDLYRDGCVCVCRPQAFLPSTFAVLETKGKIAVKSVREETHTHTHTQGGGGGVPFLLPNVAEMVSEMKRMGEVVVEEVVVV